MWPFKYVLRKVRIFFKLIENYGPTGTNYINS